MPIIIVNADGTVWTMSNTDVIGEIVVLAGDFLVYMLPVIAFMSALTFIMSFLYEATIGTARRSFRG